MDPAGGGRYVRVKLIDQVLDLYVVLGNCPDHQPVPPLVGNDFRRRGLFGAPERRGDPGLPASHRPPALIFEDLAENGLQFAVRAAIPERREVREDAFLLRWFASDPVPAGDELPGRSLQLRSKTMTATLLRAVVVAGSVLELGERKETAMPQPR